MNNISEYRISEADLIRGQSIGSQGHSISESIVVVYGDVVISTEDSVTSLTSGESVYISQFKQHSISCCSNTAKIIMVYVGNNLECISDGEFEIDIRHDANVHMHREDDEKCMKYIRHRKGETEHINTVEGSILSSKSKHTDIEDITI